MTCIQTICLIFRVIFFFLPTRNRNTAKPNIKWQKRVWKHSRPICYGSIRWNDCKSIWVKIEEYPCLYCKSSHCARVGRIELEDTDFMKRKLVYLDLLDSKLEIEK